MLAPRHHLAADLAARFARIRADLGVPESFPPEARDLAERRAGDPSAASPPPDGDGRDVVDRRDLPLISLDPEGSRDLDQALHLARHGAGFRFHYAIADVGRWVEPGDAIDVEARRRATTVYCPDVRVPLHPTALSEGAASLLEGVDRPALLWTIDLDQHGEIADIGVARALVRNHSARSYTAAQRDLDAGTADEQLRLLEEIGTLRLALEASRGGVSLELPEQVVEHDEGHYRLRYERALDVERWNAQLSLCCGMAAAQLMIRSGTGILRTLPPADATTLDRLRAHSGALGVAWPDELDYPGWVRSLDPRSSAGAALMTEAARTLRGSGYLPFDGDLPSDHRHHAIAADYAHVTAPLRRLVDRFANECVLSAAAGLRPPGWVLDALPTLPGLMATGNQLASQVDRAVVDLVEAAMLTHLVGHTFEATVTATRRGTSTIQLTDPAVIDSIDSEVRPGSSVRVRLTEAELDPPSVRFELA